MDCSEIRRFLHAYIDLEFDEREEIEFELHLGQCRSCRDEVNYYRALRRTLRQKLPNQVAPLRLETMIRETIHTEERIQRGWFSLSMATVGAFVFAVGTFLWSSHVHEPVGTTSPSMTATKTYAPKHNTQDSSALETSRYVDSQEVGSSPMLVSRTDVAMNSVNTSPSRVSKPAISVHECNLEEYEPRMPTRTQPSHKHTPWCTGRHEQPQPYPQRSAQLIPASYKGSPP